MQFIYVTKEAFGKYMAGEFCNLIQTFPMCVLKYSVDNTSSLEKVLDWRLTIHLRIQALGVNFLIECKS